MLVTNKFILGVLAFHDNKYAMENYCGKVDTPIIPGINDFKMYNQLSDLIKCGNISMLEVELNNLSKQEKDSLFAMYTKQKKLSTFQRFQYRHRKSVLESNEPLLFTAVLSGNTSVIQMLCTYGADIHIQDSNGWNLIHYLIAISYFEQSYENKAVQIYNNVKNSMPTEEHTNLLLQEDLEGLRPIEMALHCGCILLFEQIINTPGYYLAKIETRGMWKYLWYDITDYENCGCVPNRRKNSLLMILSNIEKRSILRPVQLDIIKTGMLYNWTNKKLLINLPFLLLWLSLRLLSFFIFFAFLSSNLSQVLQVTGFNVHAYHFFQSLNLNFTITDNETFWAAAHILETNPNYTEAQKNTFYYMGEILHAIKNEICDQADWYGAANSGFFFELALYYICCYGVFSIIFDIIEKCLSFFKNWSKWHTCFGSKKELVVTKWYYRACQFLYCLFSIAWGFCYLFLPDSLITQYGVIPTGFTSVWTILYFVQMLPAVGHFVNSIQRMLGIMFQFIFVYMLVLSPYPHLFKFLLTGEDGCSVDGFANIGEGIYTTFKVMLNMVEFTSYDEAAKGGSFILHIIYVFLVAILLVNFLIALLSSSVSEIVDAGDVIMMLQRLSIVTLVERRMTWFLPVYYKIMHKFTYKCENDRIYLVHNQFSGINEGNENHS